MIVADDSLIDTMLDATILLLYFDIIYLRTLALGLANPTIMLYAIDAHAMVCIFCILHIQLNIVSTDLDIMLIIILVLFGCE